MSKSAYMMSIKMSISQRILMKQIKAQKYIPTHVGNFVSMKISPKKPEII